MLNMAKTKPSKRSLSAYEVQRIILGVLLAGLIIAGCVFVYQTQSESGELGESITNDQDSGPATLTEPAIVTESEQ